MATKQTVSEAEYLRHVDEYDGICLACGKWKYGGVEPDAQGYKCPECGEHQVMGAEDALLMGDIEVEEFK